MFRGISFGSLFLVLLIVVVLFGTRRLRDLGSDLGAAVRGFRKGLTEEDKNP
jgi:sec-independent protein translocase protein TatA